MKLSLSSNSQSQWSSRPRRVLLTADAKTLDPEILSRWRDEGYTTSYLAFNGSKKDFASKLESVAEPFEFGELFALVAYGDAAAAALDVCMKPISRLCALVCYYPSRFPKTTTSLPPNLKTVIHMAAGQQSASKFPCYSYPHAKIGFAEPSKLAYDETSDGLAWSRSLRSVRKGFGVEVDLEGPWEKHLRAKYMSKDVTKEPLAPDARVDYVPNGVEVTGEEDLQQAYGEMFTSKDLPIMKMRLLSRTSGIDQVVDETLITFKHTAEVPWMLPGVKPTNRTVEVVVVTIARIRGGKLCRERTYWDQASVLAQLGLLDPSKLPVVGAEGARVVLGKGEGSKGKSLT